VNGERRIVLRNYGKIDPESIDDYIGAGGYSALNKAISMQPIQVIDEVAKSGLRGRGGAGFSTSRKWMFTHKEISDVKYVICNIDEGEPGTYKDRIITSGDPHSIIEGMAICAHGVGSKKGYIYCRGEYPDLVALLEKAIGQAKDRGLLGDFDLEVRMGAGAYVCGEETALIESIEGKRGDCRYKPPFPPISGLWGKPTVVNNVETFANIPPIIENGGEWFSGIGAPTYPGTKVITLAGDVNRKTFIEVETDVTIRDVVFRFGQGIPEGRKFKAVQIGGTSGGILPEKLMNISIDFDSLQKVGATHGTGAFFVLDETRDIVDIVECITRFFEHESCGKCTPCREGTMQMHMLAARVNSGQGTQSDLELMKKLGRVMAGASLCGLGQSAPIPVLTTLDHFYDEYKGKLRRD
jgi:NADH:ubiquinone oxidoreductase subunit F (NADH-binding)